MILYFLLVGTIFCAEQSAVPVHGCGSPVFQEDYTVYGDIKGRAYQPGALWIRPDILGTAAFYLPEGEKVHFHTKIFSKHALSQAQESHMKKLLDDVSQGVETNPWQEICAKEYNVPVADLTCAAVTMLTETLTGLPSVYNGVQHPKFHSWARYMPYSRCFSIYSHDRKVLYGNESRYALGYMWVAKENNKSILFYRPDFGPEWMYYRYDLGQDQGWPKNWLPELETIRRFAGSSLFNFASFCPTPERERCVDVAKAVLSGRAARWDEDVWFAWGPQCEENDPFLRAQSRDIVHAGKVRRGVYEPESVWLTRWKVGRSACRLRSQDGSVFQIAQARFPLSAQETLYLAAGTGDAAAKFVYGES